HSHAAPQHHEHYVVPLRNYILNATALAILMFATIAAAKVDLGPFNPAVAIGIAITKAVLIVLFFMNTWYSTRLTWIFVSLSFFWLLILFGLFLPDYFARDFAHQPNAWASTPHTVSAADLPVDKQVVHGGAAHGEH
ncbi:MAG: hypothetical protein FJY92_11220, partial [Candidatus Hydrogenedentes bacterium]|nr:hypothetical protein [Candidatus Hydrogenedentota bacterium]